MIKMNHLRKIVLLGSASAVAVGANSIALSQEGEQAQDGQDTIIVVGSAIRNSADSDTASRPVQYLERSRIDATSALSVTDFLQDLPVATGFGRNSISDEYQGGRGSINLRGLGDQYTLVLINGRRMAGENVPDINAIPPEAIEGIEILKTGASAIYGSDAVAGVVNIRLRNNFQGLELNTQYGEATLGGGEVFRVGSLFGLQDGPFSFTGSFAYQEDKGVTKFERDIIASRDKRPFGGLDFRSGTMTEPGAVFTDSDGAFGGEAYVVNINSLGVGDIADSLDDYVLRSANDSELAMSGAEQDKIPPSERWSAHWSSEYEFVPERLNFYTRGYVDNRQRSFAIHPSFTAVDVAADNPNNPFGEDVYVFYVFSPTFDVPAVDLGGTPRSGLMRFDSDILNVQGTAGFEGEFGDRFTWDFGYTYFRERANRRQRGDISLEKAQAAADSGDFNPFCFFCATEELRDSLTADYLQTRVNTVQTVDLTVSGDLFNWSGGTVQFAAGYQHRDVFFKTTSDEAAQTNSYWWNGGPEGPGGEGERNVDAFFGEVRVPLLSAPNGDFLTSAEVSGAARHENYSDFGGATVWQVLGKAGLFDEQLIIRASYAKTFRAPSVEALTAPISTSFGPSGTAVIDPLTGMLVGDTRIISGGNPDLEPENGNTLNVGLILRPDAIPNFYFSADYWNTEITDIIRTPNFNDLFQGTETAGSLTRDTPDGIPIVDIRLDNGGELEAAGIDFSGNYNLETGFGDLNFFVNGARMTKFETRAASQAQDLLDTWSGFVYWALPKWRVTTGANWDYGAFDAALTFNYTSGVRDEIGDIRRRTESYETIDLQIGYDLGEGLGEDSLGGLLSGTRVYVGADNLLGHDPVFIASLSDGAVQSTPNTVLGRFVYAGIRKSF